LGIPHENGPGGAALNEGHPPQDERARDPFPKVSFRRDQPAQLGRRDQDGFNLLLSDTIDEGRSSGQLPHFGQERTSPFPNDGDYMSKAIALADGDQSLQQDEHAWARLPHAEQVLAGGVVAPSAKTCSARKVALVQDREHLFATAGELIVCNRAHPASLQRIHIAVKPRPAGERLA
jgi:hypothetical protein